MEREAIERDDARGRGVSVPIGRGVPVPKGGLEWGNALPRIFFKFLDTNGALCVLSDT